MYMYMYVTMGTDPLRLEPVWACWKNMRRPSREKAKLRVTRNESASASTCRGKLVTHYSYMCCIPNELHVHVHVLHKFLLCLNNIHVHVHVSHTLFLMWEVVYTYAVCVCVCVCVCVG